MFRIEPPDNLPAGQIDNDMIEPSGDTAHSLPSKPD
jgi:hypothetical protein